MSAPLGGWPLMGGRDPDTAAAYAAREAILAGRFDRDLESLRRAIMVRQTQLGGVR